LFLHDGAPPHFLLIFRHHLNQVFDGQWIGHGGTVNWPARHLDRTSGLLAVGTCEDFGILLAVGTCEDFGILLAVGTCEDFGIFTADR
jgi:hypothetical protein